MALQRLDATISAAALSSVRLIATDMDGTLTIANRFSSRLLQALELLKTAKIPVLIVTGRSAGWVSGLVNYLPIAGAIAENGGLFYVADRVEPLVAISHLSQHRQQLEEMFQQLQRRFPHLRESADNPFRLTDWTFDVAGLTQDDIQQLSQMCQVAGWGFTYSNVQCHIKLAHQEKSAGLRQVLSQHFPEVMLTEVVTVGDSPNDASLFDRQQFPLSVGVANVQHYVDQLIHLPSYLTTQAEGEGFWELTQLILEARAL